MEKGAGWAFDKALNSFLTKEVLTFTRAGYTTTLNASGDFMPFATGIKTISKAWVSGFITGEVSGNIGTNLVGYRISSAIDSGLLKKLKQECHIELSLPVDSLLNFSFPVRPNYMQGGWPVEDW